jgi:hypothetical protein
MRDKLGIIDKNVGFGPGQRPPRNLNRREEPLGYECNRNWNNNTVSHITPGKGEIVCPVPGLWSSMRRRSRIEATIQRRPHQPLVYF